MPSNIQTLEKQFTKLDYFQMIGYKPHPGQLKVHMSTARNKVICTGRRWGKSLMASKEIEPLILKKHTQGWIVGP